MEEITNEQLIAALVAWIKDLDRGALIAILLEYDIEL